MLQHLFSKSLNLTMILQAIEPEIVKNSLLNISSLWILNILIVSFTYLQVGTASNE